MPLTADVCTQLTTAYPNCVMIGMLIGYHQVFIQGHLFRDQQLIAKAQHTKSDQFVIHEPAVRDCPSELQTILYRPIE